MRIRCEIMSRLKTGITWRSVIGLLYTIVVFQPAALYMTLATGTTTGTMLGAFVQWATLILFVELARLTGKPLTQQEAALIFLGSWLSSMYVIFTGYSSGSVTLIGLLYPIYYRNSDIAQSLGIADRIPNFYAPPSSEVWIQRTFFSHEWMLPLSIVLIWYGLVYIADLAIGLLARQLYIEVEKLPYPTLIPIAEACRTLSLRETRRFQTFCACAVLGVLYGTVLYGLPLVSLIVLGVEYRPIPIPWTDYNRFVHLILPGASLGIATDVAIFATGFLIPFNLVIGIFAGSLITQFFGNHILCRIMVTQFAKEWAFGMNIIDSYTRSTLYAWASPLIGVALAVGIVPFIRHPHLILNAFRISRRPLVDGVYYPLWKMLLPYILATVGISLIGYYLVPTANLLFLILINSFLSLIAALVMGRTLGTAVSFSIPYPRELMFIATGASGDVWFIPTYLGYMSDWVGGFKIADLTDLHPWSYVKATSAFVPLALLMGFVWVARFWSIAPIPSAFYPGIEVSWKINAIYQSLFYTASPDIFRQDWLVLGAVVTSIVLLIADRFRMSGLIVSGAAGLATPMPMAVSMLIGGIIGKIIEKKFGKALWNEYKGLVAGGVILGEGTITVFFVSILLLAKSIWFLPY